MSLERTLQTLTTHLRALAERAAALTLTVREDHPADRDPHLIDQLEEGCQALEDRLAEAFDVGPLQDLAVAAETGDGRRLLGALASTHELVLALHEDVAVALAPGDRWAELAELARGRRRAWQAWAEVVGAGLEGLHYQLSEIQRALLDSWRELGERLLAGGVSVSATNIGQQIRLDGERDDIDNTLRGVT